jgi:hypothetical protein
MVKAAARNRAVSTPSPFRARGSIKASPPPAPGEAFLGQWLRRQVEQFRLPALHLSIRRAAAREPGGDSRNALQAVIELSDPAKFFPWRLAEGVARAVAHRYRRTESLVTMPDESFWIGDEMGPWLLCFSIDGELLAPPVELPDNVRSADHPLAIAHADIPRLPHSRGLEAMDLRGDNRTAGVHPRRHRRRRRARMLRVQRYDTSAGKWLPGTLLYERTPTRPQSPTCPSSKATGSWSSRTR